MSKKIRWGILSTASIGVEKVIPAMQKGKYSEVVAIASRSKENAEKIAKELNIPTSYGSYEALLQDETIDAIYNPLPNHLHVHWTTQAILAGKHVLCEKPIALTTHEIQELIRLRDQHQLKVGEAYMVKSHPQWLHSLDLIKSGVLGDIKLIHGIFSFFDRNPESILNKFEIGGGALWDIGCYPVTTSRFILQEEPSQVIALMDFDPDWKVDRLASAILDFPSAQVTFNTGTQIVPHQKMHFYGSKQRLEIDIPFTAPNDERCKIYIGEGNDIQEMSLKEIEPEDQYTLQGDAFSLAILENKEVPVPLEDSLKNTAVLKALFRSAKSKKWEKPTMD